jgi:predicted RNase H-like HicB family nuclease
MSQSGCMTHSAMYVEAVKRGRDAIESWLDANRALGLPVPEPRAFASSQVGELPRPRV